VGYLTPVKGHTYLLDAIAETAGELRARHAQVNLVGDGPEMSRLCRKAATLDIQDLCHFTGAVTPDGVAGILSASDLLVLPSLRESFGLVLIEAMACGVPVLATACEGPSEIVTPGVGLLVRPGSARALAEGLRTALATLHRFNPEEIRAEAIARYDLESVGRRVVEVYRQVVRGRPG
jgi:glycosyltransferase involved in cell wall biosynthesis